MDLYIMKEGVSPWARAALVFVMAEKLPITLNRIQLFKGEHLKPEYVKLNPRHKVPFLVDNGFGLQESGAIVRYLAKKYNSTLYPINGDAATFAQIDAAVEMVRSSLLAQVGLVGFHLYFKNVAAGGADFTVVDAKLGEVKDALTFVEANYFKDDPKHVVGKTDSYADFLLCTAVHHLTPIKYDFTPFPKLAAWFAAFTTKHADVLVGVHDDFNASSEAAMKAKPYIFKAAVPVPAAAPAAVAAAASASTSASASAAAPAASASASSPAK